MKEYLTNEALKGICNNSFELAHYAIALGRYNMHSGRGTNLTELLREILKHPDPSYLEELKERDSQEE